MGSTCTTSAPTLPLSPAFRVFPSRPSTCAGGYDWGTWSQGENAGEYFVSNSNLISHQVRLHLAPSEEIGTGLIFYRFLLDQPASLASSVTSSNLASELDWYTDWKPNAHFSFSLIVAWAKPGEAVVQAYGRTQDFLYGMIFAA